MDLSGVCTMFGNCASALPMSGCCDGFTSETSTKWLATSMTCWLLGYLRTSSFDATWYRSQIFWQLRIFGGKAGIRGGQKWKKSIDDPSPSIGFAGAYSALSCSIHSTTLAGHFCFSLTSAPSVNCWEMRSSFPPTYLLFLDGEASIIKYWNLTRCHLSSRLDNLQIIWS